MKRLLVICYINEKLCLTGGIYAEIYVLTVFIFWHICGHTYILQICINGKSDHSEVTILQSILAF